MRLARIEERQHYFVQRHELLLKSVEDLAVKVDRNSDNISRLLTPLQSLANGYTKRGTPKDRIVTVGIPAGLITLAITLVEIIRRLLE